jgi:uncharacterized protein (DUF2062 family)
VLLRLRTAVVRLLRLNASPHGIALGFTLGLALSLFPVPFLGMVVALALAPAVGASLPAVYAGTAVVNPLTGAAFYFGELWLGSSLTGDELPSWAEASGYDWREWWSLSITMLPAFLLGALTLMLGATLLCYPTLRWLAGKYGSRDESAGSVTTPSEKPS